MPTFFCVRDHLQGSRSPGHVIINRHKSQYVPHIPHVLHVPDGPESRHGRSADVPINFIR